MIKWINFVKAIAIFAVIIDHNYHVLYENPIIQNVTFFSVTVFIFLSGFTASISYNKQSDLKLLSFYWKKIKTIIFPYMISVLFYLIFIYKEFSLNIYFSQVIHFNSDAIFYFVFFYFQLVLITPLLNALISYQSNNNRLLLFSLTFILIIVLSILSIKYTNILPLWGGGKHLFGGTYLLIYFSGMCYFYYENKRKYYYSVSKLFFKSLIFFILATIFFSINYYNIFSFDAFLNLGLGINPPLIDLSIYSILVILFLKYLYLLTSKINNKYLNLILNIPTSIGMHTYAIFLFHKLVMLNFSFLTWYGNKYVLIFIYFPLILIIPIFIDILINNLFYKSVITKLLKTHL